ncbi:hypothetical protein H0H92_014047 [Tricholoma furcatifolium]|nr:hypothetical protein H0H92_014047 [Tricholoma furcatifolium]
MSSDSRRNETNDVMPANTNNRSLLVTVSAKALGSLGLGLSILAIWFYWLVPSAAAVTPEIVETPRKPHPNHRSKRRVSVKVPPVRQDSLSDANNSLRSKRVYFLESLATEPESQVYIPSVLPSLIEEDLSSALSQSPTSAATLVPTKRDDESIAESDASSRRSSLSLRLPKKIHPFATKHQSEPSPVATSLPPLDNEGRHSRRSSIGFVPPWRSKGRTSDARDSSSSRPSTPLRSSSLNGSFESIQSPITSYFSLKSSRRASTPVPRPRTQPYEAPYFALPPTSANRRTFNLDKQETSVEQRMSEDNRGRQAKPARQTTFERTLLKRRSASEGWNNTRRGLKQI